MTNFIMPTNKRTALVGVDASFLLFLGKLTKQPLSKYVYSPEFREQCDSAALRTILRWAASGKLQFVIPPAVSQKLETMQNANKKLIRLSGFGAMELCAQNPNIFKTVNISHSALSEFTDKSISLATLYTSPTKRTFLKNEYNNDADEPYCTTSKKLETTNNGYPILSKPSNREILVIAQNALLGVDTLTLNMGQVCCSEEQNSSQPSDIAKINTALVGKPCEALSSVALVRNMIKSKTIQNTENFEM